MQIAPILTIVYARVQNQNALFAINLLDFCLLLSCPIENFCKDMHFFSIDQKIWHFFVKISQYFKEHFFSPQRGVLLAAEPLIHTFRF